MEALQNGMLPTFHFTPSTTNAQVSKKDKPESIPAATNDKDRNHMHSASIAFWKNQKV